MKHHMDCRDLKCNFECSNEKEITDTDRLNWVIENATNRIFINTIFKTPRDAIDAAMKEGK